MGGGREGEELLPAVRQGGPSLVFGADTFHQKSPGHQQARRQTWAFLVQNWVGRKDMNDGQPWHVHLPFMQVA